MDPKRNQDLNTTIEQYNQELKDSRKTRFPFIPRIRFASDSENAQPVDTVQVNQPRRSASTPTNQISQESDPFASLPTSRGGILDSAHEKLLTNFSRLRVELTEVLTHLEHQCRLRFEQFTHLKQAIESNRQGLEELYQIKLPADNIDAILNLRKQKKFQLQQELDGQRRHFEEVMLQRRWQFEEEVRQAREEWDQQKRDQEQQVRLSKQTFEQQMQLIEEQKVQLCKVRETELKQVEAVYKQKAEQIKQGLSAEEQELKAMISAVRDEWAQEEQDYVLRRQAREEEEQSFMATLDLNRKLDQDLYIARRSALEQELEDLKSEADQTMSGFKERLEYQEQALAKREKVLEEREADLAKAQERLSEIELSLNESVEKTKTETEQELLQRYIEKERSLEEAYHLQIEALRASHLQSDTAHQDVLAQKEAMLAEKESAFAQKENDYVHAIADLKAEHERDLQGLKSNFEAAVSHLKAEHLKALQDLGSDFELGTDALKIELQEMKQKVAQDRETERQRLMIEHERQLAALIQKHRLILSEKSKRFQEYEGIYERRCNQLEMRIVDLDEANKLLRDRLESAEQRLEDMMDNAMRRLSPSEATDEDPSRRLPKILRSRYR